MVYRITNYSLFKMCYNFLVMLPCPVNISFFWNYGSLLGFCLMIQILTGLFLSMHYCSHMDLAFDSVIHIMRDVSGGWLMRIIHLNIATAFFLCVYLHMGRGLYYKSYKLSTWHIGVVIYIVMMATAFVGYVLPWAQMSFWGATVITNFFSAIPYIGSDLVLWVWGGFSVSGPTLNRFFVFHFLLPFVLVGLVVVHLILLHDTGSKNPLGVKSDMFKIPFHKFYTMKDLFGMVLLLLLFMIIFCLYPFTFGDVENMIKANSMSTPIHIQPEWYFLFAYAILRAIPNKLGGVVALVLSLVVLFLTPLLKGCKESYSFYSQLFFWGFIFNFFFLTWLGSMVVEYPFVELGQISTMFYFIYFII
uniref:Cytochrome b n=1 Tax=Paratomella rubra TaxID=90914 RepID=A0A1X9WD78_PARRR|nr:cytochrome b [Paratomella rubra]ARS00884.1 cytochrome b [Paratomella rubra]